MREVTIASSIDFQYLAPTVRFTIHTPENSFVYNFAGKIRCAASLERSYSKVFEYPKNHDLYFLANPHNSFRERRQEHRLYSTVVDFPCVGNTLGIHFFFIKLIKNYHQHRCCFFLAHFFPQTINHDKCLKNPVFSCRSFSIRCIKQKIESSDCQKHFSMSNEER